MKSRFKNRKDQKTNLHESTTPLSSKRLAKSGRNIPRRTLITLIADENNRRHQSLGVSISRLLLNHPNVLIDGYELVERLPIRNRVDENERVAFLDVQSLHGRKLMRPCRVGDLQRANELVVRDHLPVVVLNRGHIRVLESAAHEPHHQ